MRKKGLYFIIHIEAMRIAEENLLRGRGSLLSVLYYTVMNCALLYLEDTIVEEYVWRGRGGSLSVLYYTVLNCAVLNFTLKAQ